MWLGDQLENVGGQSEIVRLGPLQKLSDFIDAMHDSLVNGSMSENESDNLLHCVGTYCLELVTRRLGQVPDKMQTFYDLNLYPKLVVGYFIQASSRKLFSLGL